MTNPGKISRLPRDIRDELNRRLDDGQPGPQILSWLNRDKTVKKILAGQFGSKPVSKQNLAAWRNGGFQQWQTRRDSMELAKELSGDIAEFCSVCKGEDGETEGGGFSDRIAQWVSVQFLIMAKSLIASTSEGEIAQKEAATRRIIRDLATLRRGDHSAARLRLQRERFDWDKAQTTEEQEKAFWKRARSPEVLGKLKPRAMDTWEGTKEVSIRLFGEGSAFLTPEEREKMYPQPVEGESGAVSQPNPGQAQSSPVKADHCNPEPGEADEPGTLNQEPGTAATKETEIERMKRLIKEQENPEAQTSTLTIPPDMRAWAAARDNSHPLPFYNK